MKIRKREKHKKEPEVVLEHKREDEKMSVIKTDRIMKIGRIILWAVILFLLVRGIASILAPKDVVKLEQIVTEYRADSTQREAVQIGAAAFAEDFAYEYYTFSGKFNSDYEQRVKRYLAKNLDIKSPVAGIYQTSVILSSAKEITYESEVDFDVDLHLQVVYMPLIEGGEKSQKDIYIRVPITTDKKGNYAVTSLPIYIPQVKAAKISSVDTYKGVQVENKEVKKIKETLESFFTAYYDGTSNEISYYLTPDSNIKEVAAGMVNFEKLDYATVSKDEVTNEYLVDTTLTVLDNNQPMKQRLFLRAVYSKKHYYIKSINTRPI